MFRAMLYHDLSIDLGTANILVSTKNNGIILREPSLVAYNHDGAPVCIGQEAWLIHEKTHSNYRTIRPLRDGVIADFEAAEYMIRSMIKSIKRRWYTTTRQMVVCVPSGITEVERQAVRNSAREAGGKQVYLVMEPMAAAIGIGLDVHSPVGHMIVDIGGGTTEIAIISLSGVVHAQSLRVAGNKLTEDIINYFRRTRNLLIGERTAEMVKCEIGSACPLEKELTLDIKGQDLVNGLPRTLKVTSQEVREAISPTVDLIVNSVIKSLEQAPPEFAADILDNGITLAGGGALLKNLDKQITLQTDIPSQVAEDPLTAVVRGTGMILDNLDRYRSILY